MKTTESAATSATSEDQLDAVTGGVWLDENGRGCFPIAPLGRPYLPPTTTAPRTHTRGNSRSRRS